MKMKRWFFRKFAFVLCAAYMLSVVGIQASSYEQKAKQILSNTGVKGGLIVHIGCRDGKLTSSLRANDRYVVHGLDADPDGVAKARRYIQGLGLYGKVSVETFDGRDLPYVDNLVNLLVVEDSGQVPMKECLRVLTPNGIAYIKSGSRWNKTVKPWPEAIDEWTHFLHDASNNPVAADMRVGPPRRMQWTCGPLWARSHEFTSSLIAMVSGGGRLYYIFDEGLTGVTTPTLPEKWVLIARDAFNGTLLWRRPLKKWGTSQWRNKALRSIPPTAPRSLVADGQRLYVTLDYQGPVSALDAATGEIIRTYEQTENCQELRNHLGVLLFRKGANAIMAVDAGTGITLWTIEGKVQPQTLAAIGERTFWQGGGRLHAVEFRNGRPLWDVPSAPGTSLLVAYGDKVVTYSKQGLAARAVADGNELWAVKTRLGHNEFFIANGLLWQWKDEGFVGRDLANGQVVRKVDASDVFTPGHHPRCYRSKATENYLITPWRGAEFIGINGGANVQNDWLRGPCRYGIMPANGLLYVPPNPCFCYPGAKVTGFNVLGPAVTGNSQAKLLSKGERLKRGKAYRQVKESATSDNISDSDWSTYRQDALRRGAAVCEVPEQIYLRWCVDLQGELTQPVVAGNKLYVVAKNEHTLYTFDAKNGDRAWQFTAGGRIDSPPTIYGDLVLFGSSDGCVYCLRASDGELTWRFHAAPSNQRIIAFGQLESPWRVHGSVLIKDGVAYCTAGRSTYLDGGIRIFGLDPKSGKVLYETRLDTWARTRKDAENKPFIPAYHMEGTSSDILVSEGDHIFLGQYKFDRALTAQEVPYIMPDPDTEPNVMDLMGQPFVENMDSQEEYETVQHDWQWRIHKAMMQNYQKMYGGASMGDRNIGLHVFSTSGFLDDSWFNRTFWMYSATWPGFYMAHRGAKSGQLLVVGPEKTYAVQSYPSRNLQSPLFTPGKKGYLLLADENDNEPVLADYTRGVPKGIGFTRQKLPAWFKWVSVRIRGMVLAGRHLFVAGPRDIVDTDDPMAAFEGRKGALLYVHSAVDGRVLAEHKLEAPPVFDGLIAANARLYLSLENGTVVCLGPNR
ncbi:MAG: outer membrane protein assembly factor BamB family protein [Planctomycetota bacterium]|jgi:outer membrane protein assembly factor BamB